MSAPHKPWEYQINSHGHARPMLHSSNPSNIRPEAVRRVAPISSANGIPPPVPPRPVTMGGYRPGVLRNNYGYTPFSSPYDYGGYPYGGYRSIGMPSVYGYGRRYGTVEDFENRYVQIAEESSRPAFQSIESLVRAFTSVSMMLESTFHAMYTSFRAVLDVAENFSRLRQLLVQFFSVVSLLRFLQSYYKRLLYSFGIEKEDPTNDMLWQQAKCDVQAQSPRQSVWPIFTFLGLMFGGPYIMSRLIKNFQSGDQGKNWDPALEPGTKVIAMYPYEASSEGELSFGYREVLQVAPSQEQLLNSSSVGWLLAANENRCMGYIPKNYVCSILPSKLQYQRVGENKSATNVPVHQNLKTDVVLERDVMSTTKPFVADN